MYLKKRIVAWSVLKAILGGSDGIAGDIPTFSVVLLKFLKFLLRLCIAAMRQEGDTVNPVDGNREPVFLQRNILGRCWSCPSSSVISWLFGVLTQILLWFLQFYHMQYFK